MILVDVGIWSAHFRRSHPRLVTLLEADLVLVHPWIIGELALGPGLRLNVLDDLGAVPQSPRVPDDELLAFVRLHAPRGIGWVDAQLLVSALGAHARLWTGDAALARVAARFEIAWSPSR